MKSKAKNMVYYGLPLIGTLLCLYYIKIATCNIVYTDYIRIVNSYLPDVWNPEKFFVADVLTRIPIHYLGRIVNTMFFDYSTTFDMALGILSLGLSGMIIGMYSSKQNLGIVWYCFLMLLLFGFNKWEMMTNGTGWGHFLAISCFYYHYCVFDRMVHQQGKPRDKMLLLVLPWIITIGIAGPYCAVYSVTMLVFYLGMFVTSKDRVYWMKCCICILIPLLCYVVSNSFAIEDHAGAYDISLLEVVQTQPIFLGQFLLKSLASIVVGCESLENVSDSMIYALGFVMGLGYVFAIYANFRYNLYKKTWLPLMLLLAGVGNHAVVLVSRYIFLKDTYGMSSRYTLQYQIGLLGIILTMGFLWNYKLSKGMKLFALLFCCLIFVGHMQTNYDEYKKAPYREAYAENIAQVARDYQNVDDDTLRKTFDYRTSLPDSGEKVRQALTILEEQGWGVFAD